MSTGTALATTERSSVIREMAHKYGMEPDTFEATVRATCMPQGNNVQPMTREEFAAGIMVAEKYTLNPILREIYFYPRKGGGIVPVVSIDGWLSLINRRKELDGIEFDELHDEKGKLVSITCRIYRTDRKHPTIVTEHLSECWRDTIPWKMPHRMLRHKALIQCARYAFGFAGIHDEDEAERIVEAVAVQQITGPSAPPPPPAVDPAVLAAFRDVSTATISDCLARMPVLAGLRPFHRGGPLVGTAFTVRVRSGDNLAIHQALEEVRPGDVIVVDGGGDTSRALVGDIMKAIAESRGVAGFVIDGAVRDTAACGLGLSLLRP